MWKNSYGSHAACIDRKYKEDIAKALNMKITDLFESDYK